MKLTNNNISPLPFYDALSFQNHRKDYAYGQVYPLITYKNMLLPFQVVIDKETNWSIISASLIDFKTGLEAYDVLDGMVDNGLQIKQFESCSIIKYPGNAPIETADDEDFREGMYYLKIRIRKGSSSANQFDIYSDVFVVTNMVADCLVIEYGNSYNLEFKDGIIDFSDDFKFRCYLNAEIGKPEYYFEEEVSERMGYSFIESQVSKKIYKFNFLAPEYLCDALRIVRLCDTKKITSQKQTYDLTTFAMSSDWQDQGDIASVDCEFETDTVIANIGGYAVSAAPSSPGAEGFINGTLGGLLNVNNTADDFSAAPAVLVKEADSSTWSMKPLSSLSAGGVQADDLRTLTIKKNGTIIGTYKPNANKTIDITDVASAAALTTHIDDTTKHITAEEREKWNKVAGFFEEVDNGLGLKLLGGRYFLTENDQVVNGGAAGSGSGSGAVYLNDLGDVTISGAQSGQVLKYNGTKWVNATVDTSGGGTVDLSGYATTLALDAHIDDNNRHVTTAERTKWNKVATDFAAITGTDSDTIINKWEEVVAFLDTYTEADTLAGLLSNKADKSQLASYVKIAGDTMTGALTIKSNNYNKTLVLTSTTTTVKSQGAGIAFLANKDAAQGVLLRHEWFDTFATGYGLAICNDSTDYESGDNKMFLYNTGRYISKAPQGTKPIDVVSTTLCTNLNADLLDGVHLTSLFRECILNAQNLDANNLTDKWVCYMSANDMDSWGNATFTNFPTSRPVGGFVLMFLKEGNYSKQLYTRYNDSHLYVRHQYYINKSIVWSDWSKVALTTDNVASATRLATTSTYSAWGQTFFANGVPQSVSGNLTLGSNNAIVGGNSVAILKDHGNNNVTVNASKGDLYLGYQYTGNVRFHSGNTNGIGTEKMTLLSNGNFGIGTSAPTEKLHVNGSARVASLKIGDSTLSWVAASGSTPGYLKVSTALVTDGDQSVLGGTGGSGTGFSGYLGDLSDVTITSAKSGQALVYNGSKWVNQAISTGLDSSALNGYATQTWVSTQGFATEQWVLNKQYLTTHQSLDYINVQDIRATTPTPSDFKTKSVTAFFTNSDKPGSDSWYAGLTVRGWANSPTEAYSVWQLAASAKSNANDNTLYFRAGFGSTWKAWQTVVTSANIGSYAITSHQSLSNYMKFTASANYVNASFNLAELSQKAVDTYIECWDTPGWWNIRAGSFSIPGGTSSQFLKANGSVDSTAYLPSSSYTAADVLAKIKTVDGSGSGLDADLLDGHHASDFRLTTSTVPIGYITYGGPVINNILGVCDIVDGVSLQNKFEALPASYIQVEKWNGSAWVDGGLTDTQKTSLVSLVGDDIAGLTDNSVSGNKIRVTITAAQGILYFYLSRLSINIATIGLNNTTVLLEGAKIGSESTFTTIGTYPIAGWSGWNSIYLKTHLGGSSNKTAQYRKIRLTFSGTATTGQYASEYFRVYNILAYGVSSWSTASTLNKWNRPYTYDVMTGDATFVKGITAKGAIVPNNTRVHDLGSSTKVWSTVYCNYLDTEAGYALKFKAAGTERMRINQSNGYVGINNSSPSYMLDVTGIIRATTNVLAGGSLACTAASGDGTYGLSLYEGPTNVNNYGMLFARTASKFKHGAVQGDWATYLTMAGATNRGWIFAHAGAGVASISGTGALVTNGDQTVSSDATLKRDLRPIAYTVKQIANAPAVTFDWIDGRTGRSAGSIAQYWQPIIPELVHGSVGDMSLAYGQIALINSILEARVLTDHEQRIKQLEEENKQLKHQIQLWAGQA